MVTRRRNIIHVPIATVARLDAPGHQANIHFFDRRRGHCNLQGDTSHLIRVLIPVLEDLARLEGKTIHDVLEEVRQEKQGAS